MSAFVIIFEYRSGSSMLISLLNSHPEALCYPEILNNQDHYAQLEILKKLSSHEDVREINEFAAPDRFFPEGFKIKWSSRPFSAVGLKSNTVVLRNIPAVMRSLERSRIRLIYLTRENPVKAVLSFLNGERLAKKTGRWELTTAADRAGSLSVDIDLFLERLQWLRINKSLNQWFYERTNVPKLRITYEALAHSQPVTTRAMCSFLDLANHPLTSKFVKPNADNVKRLVVNYNELAAALQGTEYAVFLTEREA
jgi:LPS sulfotransferase NodH